MSSGPLRGSLPPGLDLAARASEAPDGIALLDEAGQGTTWAQLAALAAALALPDAAPHAFVARADSATFVAIHAHIARGIPFMPLHPRLGDAERTFLVEALLSHGSGSGSGSGSDSAATLAVLATSGTTAVPKGVLLTRGAFVRAATASAANLPLSVRHRWIACMPLAHAGGLSVVTRALIAGAGVILLPRFDPGGVLDAVRRLGGTHLSVVPTMLRALLEHPDRDALAGLEAVLVGGAACPDDLLREARARGVTALATYGLTESCSQVTTQPPSDRDRDPDGDSGMPLPGVTIEVRGADGQPLGVDREGVIAVRGPAMTSGYLGGPPRDPAAWLETGDVGVLRGDGRLVILARRTDLIVTGGENVAPAAVEAALRAHPGIADAVVFGVDDPRWGHVVAAVVQLHDLSASGRRAVDEVADQLAPHARPRRIAVAGPDESIPRTAKGEPDRAAARARWRDSLS